MVKEIFVVGTGVMAQGIAQVFLQKKFKVTMYDKFNENKIIDNLEKIFLEKIKLSIDETKEIILNLDITSNIEAAEKADFVIEAIIEDIKIKKEIFKKLDSICKKDTILATNTSSLSITEIASSTNRAEKVVGMHFFNPVGVMKLVEIIKGIATSEETINVIESLVIQLDKESVVAEEVPGFIVNRILIPMINEAILLLEQGVATVEEIDKAMKLGANHPIGPLALSDLIGNDVVLKIMGTLLKETGDTKYRSSYLLKKKVYANQLGRKTKNGFYKY